MPMRNASAAASSAVPSTFLQRPAWRLVLAGLVVYFIFLIVNLPASVLFTQLAKRGIQASTITGTLWHGRAGNVQVGVLQLGTAEWQLRFLPLFVGKLAADVKLTPVKGFAQGAVSLSLGGTVVFNEFSASLPLESVVGAGGLPGGWTGTVQAKLGRLVLKDNWPVAAKGTLDIIDLAGPARQPINIGAYRVTFAGEQQKDVLTGALQDAPGAAIAVNGTLKFAAGRSYELDTLVAARPNTPESIAQSMQALGPPDAQGRRPFSVAGSM